MGIWAEIKKALNSTVGTSSFNPLDTVIGNKINTAKDTVVSDISALQTHLGGGNVPIIKHIQRGSLSSSGNGTVSLSGFTNSNKMIALINGEVYDSENRTKIALPYVSSLTTTALTISYQSIGSYTYRNLSYQVIEFY